MYEQHILQILSDVGKKGISVSLLARHVYNMSITLFSKPDFDDVFREVRNFVLRNTRSKKGLLEHASRWGYYCLNAKGMAMMRQSFASEEAAADSEKTEDSLQLSLDFTS
ncbi:MAG: hypothetical protein J6Z14_00210 [Prevotella sp.]|nr:hypothetical protein [Prevotella sp.]